MKKDEELEKFVIDSYFKIKKQHKSPRLFYAWRASTGKLFLTKNNNECGEDFLQESIDIKYKKLKESWFKPIKIRVMIGEKNGIEGYFTSLENKEDVLKFIYESYEIIKNKKN
ncbi:MAG TPA: hypothetical protein VIK86_00325 [Candidatus Paceibacterota bacterium]